jgi:hypothetical protein
VHLQINLSVKDLVREGILFYDPRGKQGKRNPHVFKSVERGGEVKVFDVKAHILSPRRAEHAVPKEFGCHDVRCLCCQFAGVIDEVTTGCDSDSVGICFLGTMIDDHPRVRDNSVLGDVWDVGWEHDEHCICARLPCFVVALTHPAKVFTKCRHPCVRSRRIVYEVFIAANGFAGDGVYHRHGVVFKVLGRGSVLAQVGWSEGERIIGLFCGKEVSNGFLADEAHVAQPRKGEPVGPSWHFFALFGHCARLTRCCDACALRRWRWGRHGGRDCLNKSCLRYLWERPWGVCSRFA